MIATTNSPFHEAMPAVLKTAPAVAVTGVSIAGVALQDWVYLLTIVYLLLQIGVLIVGKVRKGRRGR
jgi:hypothetical protein